MITLPQLITTDTDVAAGLQSGKAVDSPEDFLALLAGALGAGDAQGKDAPLSLADLQAAGSKLQKGLLQKNRRSRPDAQVIRTAGAKRGTNRCISCRHDRRSAIVVSPHALLES